MISNRRKQALEAEIARLKEAAIEEIRNSNPSPVPLGAPGSIMRKAWELQYQIVETALRNQTDLPSLTEWVNLGKICE